MTLTHVKADLFTAPPPRSILVHACNTVGKWGSGIAVPFRERFPEAFDAYKTHCDEHTREELIGTCLIIPGKKYDIACLFTSKLYSRKKDGPEDILRATRSAVEDLMRQNTGGQELHACRFNSGKFAVPWEQTEAVLKELGVDMTVYQPLNLPPGS
ncbi:hypothetical protein CYLTODRAFT_438009 [Cylindrobasidium torrendii FP15055 ss-10]|uniref:ADP-ribose 1''-phosphate phosphatase n=1 Tax=Cylindrobasidium torrendii FP15055 ss-10 TaxID=1314674 RepID=A0A0D7B666_9AGAR|nr:hypothetical protein CYLTODRAFT_438009 [Cylindrobasidium torrendii FP15055 ss-10]